MNSRMPRKKVDFFNRGRGLSGFCENEDPMPSSSPNPLSSPSPSPMEEGEYPYQSPQSPSNYPLSFNPPSPAFSPPPGLPPSHHRSPSPNYHEYEYSANYPSYNHIPFMHKDLPTHSMLPPHPPATSPHFPHSPPCVPLPYANYSPLRPMDTNGAFDVMRSDQDGSVGVVGGESAVSGVGMSVGVGMGASWGGTECQPRRKRQQHCSLCSNHGLQVEVKGHKWFCPYRTCDCDRCEITRGRQHHMKEQQKLTRHLNRMQ